MIRKLLIALFLLFPGVAHADWYEADSKHFAVLSKDDPQHLQKYAEQLERFDKAMRVLRGIDDPPVAPINRVSVYVVRDAAEIESLSSYGVRGFYRADIGGPVAFVPKQTPSKARITGSRVFTGTSGGQFDLDGDSVLRHEYSHHFMFDNYPGMALPMWFVEGFAEFHATAIFNDDGSVTFGAPPAYRAASLIDRNRMTVRDMLTSDTRRMDLSEVSELYGRGWLLIHYMTFAPDRRGQLGSFLAALNQGKTPIEAAQVFGDLDVLQRELAKWIAAPKITVRTIPAAAIKIEAVTVRKLSDGEAAAMAARIRTKAGVDSKSASGVLAMARKAADQFPQDVAAQLELAEAALDAKDYATARGAADRVIAIAPTSEKAYVFKGRAEMAIAKAAKLTDSATWTEVRRNLIRANRLENHDPEALLLYYQSYAAAGQPPTATSKTGLYEALDLLPDESTVRVEAVFQYIADGDYAKAKETLAPIAYGASHTNRFGRFTVELAEALNAGDKTKIDAAVVALKHELEKAEAAT
jgi:tetratricopeptide (TPR) repeat protein